jgi:hypothetical protein
VVRTSSCQFRLTGTDNHVVDEHAYSKPVT